MSIAFVQEKSGVVAGNVLTQNVVLPAGVTSGNTVVLAVAPINFSGGTHATPTVSGLGATWSQVEEVLDSNTGFYHAVWKGLGCTTGTTITVTWASPATSVQAVLHAAEFSGVDHIDSADSNFGFGNPQTSPSTVTLATGDAIYGAFDWLSNTGAPTYTDSPAAWASLTYYFDAGFTGSSLQPGYRIATGGETPTRSFSLGTTHRTAMLVAALRLPRVALTGSVTQEHALDGLLTVAVLSGHVTAEHVLAGTLTVSVVAHPSGAITAEQLLAATLTVTMSVASWSTDDIERTDLPLELSAILDVTPVETPPPATDPYIQRVSLTMPTPTLTNGLPTQPWTATEARSDWGRLQLVIAGVDRSRPRGVAFQPISDAHTDPFGDAEAAFAFPSLTEFDDPATWGLSPLAPVTLRRKDLSGVFHTLYEGAVASIEPADPALGLVVQCVGAVYRLDLLKEPPRLLTQSKDYGDLIAETLNDKRRRYFTNTGYCRHVTTGVKGVRNADFQPLLTGTIQDYLAELQMQGSAYTLTVSRPRTPVLKVRDTTTIHATVSYGAPGVDVKLSKDYTTGTTAVYGSGSDGHCTWMGARFPNLHQGSTPTFPLAVGGTFVAGDGQAGFSPFAAYLRSGQYGSIESDDTYLATDFDSVEQFQDRAGITVDGIVGAQSWTAAFQPGANQGSIYGAYVDTIYEKPQTRRRLYNAQGADVGANPTFDPTVPRIEDYVPFGDNVSKPLGRTSAKQIIAQNYPVGRVGTITLTSDPTELSRFDLDSGMNIEVQNYAGSSVLLHITRRVRDWQNLSVTLTVDEKARDLLTAASIHQRNKDVSDLTRRQRFGRQRSKVFNDYGTWLCEDGAGHIPLMNQQGGFWNVQRIAAAPKGSIERVSLAMGSGLTQHLVNQTVSDAPPASIPGATRGAMALFTQPITANALGNLNGLGTPTTNLGDGTNPWDVNNDALVNTYGMIYAAGGPGAAIGFYPNNDPGDGSSTLLTGIYEDGGSIDFGPTGHYWIWVAMWTVGSCKVGGRVFPGPPS